MKKYFFTAIVQKFVQLKKYSRWKKRKKNYFHHRFKNAIVTSKLIRRNQHISIDSKGILKQSESEEAPNKQEGMGSNSFQVSSAIHQD